MKCIINNIYKEIRLVPGIQQALNKCYCCIAPRRSPTCFMWPARSPLEISSPEYTLHGLFYKRQSASLRIVVLATSLSLSEPQSSHQQTGEINSRLNTNTYFSTRPKFHLKVSWGDYFYCCLQLFLSCLFLVALSLHYCLRAFSGCSEGATL